MPDPCTIQFHDYYEAVMAAHQLEDEGHRAFVHDYGIGSVNLPGCWFRVVVFEDGLTREQDEDSNEVAFGELAPGPLGQKIDNFVRLITAAAICLAPGHVIYLFFNARPPVYDPAGAAKAIVLSPLLLISAGIFTVIAYDSFREKRPFGLVVILGVGWTFCISYVVNFAIMVVFFFRYMIDLG